MRSLFSFLLFAIALSLASCTHNPFDDDSIPAAPNTITGQVLLADHRSPEIVIVWLQGFDLSTHPDKDGNFQLQLPAPSLQPYGGLTGSYKIYFFLANYQLDSAEVFVKNGLLMTSTEDIDKNGHLRQRKLLTEKLRIILTVSPDTMSIDSTAGMSFELRLEATADTIYIQYPDRAAGPLSILYFKNLSSPEKTIQILENSEFASTAPMIRDSITTNPNFYLAGANFASTGLAESTYEIIPFFIIEHKKVPRELLDNIGHLIDKPSLDFLKVPTYRTNAYFTLTGIGLK